MKRPLTQFAGQMLAEVWLRAASERVELEWNLLATILFDPARGLPSADRFGVNASWFTEQDLLTIYLSAVACRQLGFGRAVDGLEGVEADRLRIYRLAKHGLRDSSHWDDASRQWFGPLWSDETLSALFDAEFTTLFVPRRARLLDDLAGRQREASEHLRYAWKILGGNLEAVQ